MKKDDDTTTRKSSCLAVGGCPTCRKPILCSIKVGKKKELPGTTPAWFCGKLQLPKIFLRALLIDDRRTGSPLAVWGFFEKHDIIDPRNYRNR